jgi:hypothetical protein
VSLCWPAWFASGVLLSLAMTVSPATASKQIKSRAPAISRLERFLSSICVREVWEGTEDDVVTECSDVFVV